MISLKSGISREINGHFILDESGLRRISEILYEKAKDLPYPCSVIFHVKREDHRFYESTQVEDILSDANVLGSQIHSLRIELRNADPNKVVAPWEKDWIVAIQYSKNGYKQGIEVASENKNWALLLADAIEPHITRTFTAKKIPTWILIPSYIVLAYLVHTIFKNYIESTPGNISTYELFFWIGAIFLSISSLGNRHELISKWAGPKSCFHWGEQAKSYDHYESTRQNIFWVVIVGFVVSIMATIYSENVLPKIAAQNTSTTGTQKLNANKSSTK